MTINLNRSYCISALPEPKNARFIESSAKKFKALRPAKTINWPDLITRDMATTTDKNLQRATLIDSFLSKKQYTRAHEEIIKIADLDLKEFYTIVLIDHVINLNKPLTEIAALSLRPGILKDNYLAQLGRSYLNEDKSSQAKVLLQAMTVPADLLNHFQTLILDQDNKTLTRLNLLCDSLKVISYKQAEIEIKKIQEPALQDPFRARFGEILFRNGKSREALALVQEIIDLPKKDETYANLVEIAHQTKQLKKALFFLDLITTSVSRFDRINKKDELLSQIVGDYLSLNNATDSIEYFDQIQNEDLKNKVKNKILASYHTQSQSI